MADITINYTPSSLPFALNQSKIPTKNALSGYFSYSWLGRKDEWIATSFRCAPSSRVRIFLLKQKPLTKIRT